MKGIDLFVKILVFAKSLSQGRRKEEGQQFRSLEVRGKLIAHKNDMVYLRPVSSSFGVSVSRSHIFCHHGKSSTNSTARRLFILLPVTGSSYSQQKRQRKSGWKMMLFPDTTRYIFGANLSRFFGGFQMKLTVWPSTWSGSSYSQQKSNVSGWKMMFFPVTTRSMYFSGANLSGIWEGQYKSKGYLLSVNI